MAIQDELNRIAGTTDRTSQDALNIIAGTSNLEIQEAANIWAGTTNRLTQDCYNIKASTTNLLKLDALKLVAGGGGGAPSAPVATAATNVLDISFTANWGASGGATSYRLDVSTDNFATFVSGFNDLNVGSVTTYSVTGLTAGVAYKYRVRAVNGSGTSGNSNTIDVTTASVYRMPIIASSSTYSNTATEYIGFGGILAGSTLALSEVLHLSATTLKSLRVYVRSNSAANDATVSVIVNGVASAMTLTITAGVTGWFETSATSLSIAANDLVCAEITRTDAGAIGIETLAIDNVTTNTAMLHIGSGNASTVTGGGTIRWIRPNGSSTVNTATTTVQSVAPCAMTITSLAMYVSANTRLTNNNVRIDINGVSSGIVVTIPLGTTGWFSATGSAAVAAGDIITVRFANGASTGSITPRQLVWESVASTTGVNGIFMGRGSANFQSAFSPLYSAFAQQLEVVTGSVDANDRIILKGAGTIKNMYGYMFDNSADGTVDYTTRKNGSSQSLAIAIPTLTDGTFSDTTDTVSFVNNDSLNLQVTRGGTGVHTAAAISYEFNPTIEVL